MFCQNCVVDKKQQLLLRFYPWQGTPCHNFSSESFSQFHNYDYNLNCVTMSSSSAASKVVLKRKKSSLSEIRICVLGDRDVGKSGTFLLFWRSYLIRIQLPNLAVVVRFLTRRFIMEYESGIDNRYRQELLVENEPVIFDVLDSSCNHSLTPANIDTSFVTSVDIVLLIYSITDRGSFQYIRNLMRHFAQIKNNCNLSLIQLPLIAIVGNKCDLEVSSFVNCS